MEDLLPILIGIIWVAITLYNKGKKKKNTQRPVLNKAEERRPISIFEQILMGEQIGASKAADHFYESIEESFSDAETVATVPSQTYSRPFLNDELAQFSFEGQSVSESTGNKTIEEVLQEQEPEFEGNDFEIRKAIIYSEILKAPYIDYK
jgi:hypothetical protein